MDTLTIKALLRRTHTARGDFFIEEVKDGPTWMATSLRILDAWALRMTWMKYESIGYEIKVSRSDFKQDKKWESYLPYCSRFSFVCPAEMIYAHELPSDIGLYWVKDNWQMRTIRKPQFIEREPDPMFLLSVLKNKVFNYRISVTGADEVQLEMVRLLNQLINNLERKNANLSRDLWDAQGKIYRLEHRQIGQGELLK